MLRCKNKPFQLNSRYRLVGTKTLPTTSSAQTCALFGVANDTQFGPGTLYSIDPSNGSGTSIGPLDTSVNTNGTNAMDFLGSTPFYSISSSGSGNSYLFTIDTKTGLASAPTQITFSGSDVSQIITALRFFQGTGYAIGIMNNNLAVLYVLNISTATLTEVGIAVQAPPRSFIFGGGAYIDPQGNLFMALTFSPSFTTVLYQVDKSTAAASILGNITYSQDIIRASIVEMVYSPCDGKIYISVLGLLPTQTYLGTLDPSTLLVTIIGALPPLTYSLAVLVSGSTVSSVTSLRGVLGCRGCYLIQPPPTKFT